MRPWASCFNYLRQRGCMNRAIILMMSDHGESLGAHGESMHGIFLYDETIHVPLLVKLPDGSSGRPPRGSPSAPGRRCSHPSQHAEPASAADFSGRVAGAADEDAPRKRPTICPLTPRPTIRIAHSGGARCAPCARGNICSSARPNASFTTQAKDQDADHNLAASSPAVAQHFADSTG